MEPTARTTFVSRAILIKGVLNVLLGGIHIIGTFTFEAQAIDGQGSADLQRGYLMWFFGVGVAILFSALVDFFCVQGLRANMNLAWRIAILSAAFTTIAGVTGVSLYGISPPLQLLATGVASLAILGVFRKGFATD